MSSDLISRIRDRPGSERRWAAWYKAAYPKVYYAAFRLARGNPDTALELTQESFARFLAYEAIDRVTSDEHAVAFLIKTCRNLAIDRNARAREVPLEDLADVESIPAPDQAIDSAVDLERILKELDPEDRKLMQLARDGVNTTDIAARLGVSYTAAGVRLHRLRKRLREAYGEAT